MKINKTNWRWFFSLAALEAGAALLLLFLVPHEEIGFSLTQLEMLGIPIAFFVSFFFKPNYGTLDAPDCFSNKGSCCFNSAIML